MNKVQTDTYSRMKRHLVSHGVTILCRSIVRKLLSSVLEPLTSSYLVEKSNTNSYVLTAILVHCLIKSGVKDRGHLCQLHTIEICLQFR